MLSSSDLPLSMPKRSGGKFSGSHTTMIDAAASVVDAAAKDSAVTKIVLGIIQAASSKTVRIKFKEVPAGWELTVHGRMSLQTIYIYTTDKIDTRRRLEAGFSK